MTSSNVMEYKGYIGTVEFSAKDNILFGKVIGINGLVSYEGDSILSLREDFEAAVDDYLETCEEKGIEPQHLGSDLSVDRKLLEVGVS